MSDGYGATSSDFTQRCIEFSCEEGWGFELSCKQLADGIGTMQTSPNAIQEFLSREVFFLEAGCDFSNTGLSM